MFQDGCTLWELLAAVRSTPVSDELPSPSVLLQGRNLRGSLPFLPKNLESRVPASFVQLQLHARQGVAAFHATRRHDVLSSVLFVGRTVRAHMGSRWLPGVVEAVCKEPNSYSARLVDGRVFRRTRWNINKRVSSQSFFRLYFFCIRLPLKIFCDILKFNKADVEGMWRGFLCLLSFQTICT